MKSSSRSHEEILRTVQNLLSDARVPGCSLAVVGPYGVKWCASFGYADINAERRAERTTVYHLFSGTKLFTATAVLQLAEQGRLDIDAPARTYLPELPQLGEITLRGLLTHTSGLKDTLRGFLAVYFPGEDPPDTMEALRAYELPRYAHRKAGVRYRNVDYALLGEVISRVSGMAYTDYVRDRILAPLGSDAAFDVASFEPSRMATGYLSRWDPQRLLLRMLFPSVARRLYRGQAREGLLALGTYNLSTAAIGGLVGSVDSFAPFLQSQLSGGDSLVSEATAERMQSLVAEGRAGVESRTGVGLGWKIGDAGDCRFLNHEGIGAGFTSELRLYPDRRLGMVVLMNKSSMSKTMRVAHRVCESIRREGDF